MMQFPRLPKFIQGPVKGTYHRTSSGVIARWAAVLVVLAIFPDASLAQETPAGVRAAPAANYVWAPKPVSSPFVAPDRPHWKLSEILAAHAGQKDWSQLLVRDPGALTAKYIQMGPGEKTKTELFAETSIFWVVESGQIRFTIQGQQPFVASKNFIVQVPMRTAFSLETVGDVPSLRFEVSHTRATPLYPVGEAPDPVEGEKYMRAIFMGAPPGYAGGKPYLDFQKDIVEGGGKPGSGSIHDTETSANIIRGPGVPTPPDSDPGHFHDGNAEFFFVLEGHLNLLVEGVPLIQAAEPGDVLYAPAGRWHRTNFTGEGMSSRISIHGVSTSLLILDPEHSGTAQ